jgi:uncharacterized protein YbjT (DUF2867 family)
MQRLKNVLCSGEGLSAVRFDFDDPDTLAAAMDGVSGLFLIVPMRALYEVVRAG